MKPGPKNLITDVAGLLVGNAQDDVLKSGTTVVTAANPFVASVHVMGGAPGSRETDLLAPDKSVTEVEALVLSGGSAYGLDACSGVVDGLRAQGRGFQVRGAVIPLVPGAILFDLLNGGEKDWTENPYRALGRAAFEDASADFMLGSFGAGTGALTAMVKGGLGSASLVLPDGSTVGALVAANPVGAVTTPGDKHFFAAPFEIEDEFGGQGVDPATGLGLQLDSRKMQAMSPRENTTIAIIATDAPLTKAQCQRVAVAAHDGIARATVPAHTPHDGDLVFALSTGTGPAVPDTTLIGHAAAQCLARAIARAAYEAAPADGDLLPCWSTLNA
ncbi:P1 family peptidase [Sulfitobacter mediterraneus]|uniref:P1 family peptidase n=1 Tax=Sulfitobacter mediterraneus TaxID=83219 RepID=UPI0019343D2B|nr:P1 family peptidase [Sulfitobacter mediterraneus]MBM1632875.1 P1 family peptidase [Sulfitobacter mediterraneus]MBM1640991.1 P1 family peptidase [Sulfitobacter mediterraneus]MBM1644740.1 P1 family peptidase [Sulfitobacter mediterraneus]MBM1649111.1 P1 family peptidase [Sulfitobacter mediterraneus]MBM1653132.1 P1 family peptidase [Sulfitobacter mediterraneus]